MKKTQMIGAILLSLALFAIVLPLQSAYIEKIEVTVYQPDNSKLELFASGDEFHNWLHDEDNYTIIQDPKTGWYCYAEADGENDVKASSHVVGRVSPKSVGIEPKVNISESRYKQYRQERFPMPAQRNAPTVGTINNIVVFIRFSDETEFNQSMSNYVSWFNTATNSQKNYFLEASYNQLTVDSHFFPAASGGYVVSWQDSRPRSYYQPYNAVTNPNGYNGDDERKNREFALLVNAVNGVQSQIPQNLVIDSDGDGYVDNVVFVIKGNTDGWSELLWPHRWSLYDRIVRIHGKRVYDFNFQLQNFLSSRGVGVICHEFFHTLGAPDLYRYVNNTIDPAGSWDLMCSDKNPPQHMTAFMKYKYGGWIDHIPTIEENGAYTLNPLTSASGQCYKIPSQNPNQYYVVEFRKKTGLFEGSVPGSGLLVYRIDTSVGNGNAQGPPDELYVYRPNGTSTSNGNINQAHFSLQTGRTEFHSATNPTPFLQYGTPGNLYLCEIGSSSGSTMSFRLGAPPLITPDVQISRTNGMIQLSWQSNPGDHSYKIFATDDPNHWPQTPVATVSSPSYQFNEADARCLFFKVVAVPSP